MSVFSTWQAWPFRGLHPQFGIPTVRGGLLGAVYAHGILNSATTEYYRQIELGSRAEPRDSSIWHPRSAGAKLGLTLCQNARRWTADVRARACNEKNFR